MATVTLAQLDARLLDRLDGNSIMFPQNERFDALNEAMRTVNLLTGFSQATASMGTSQANKHFYDVPAPIMFPFSITFNGRTLNKRMIDGISQISRDWLTDNTLNYGPTNNWIPIGISIAAIHPADTTGSVPMSITGVADNTNLVNLTDAIVIPDEYADMIADLAQTIVCLKIPGKAFADSSLSYQRFSANIKEEIRWDGMTMPRYWIIARSEK